MATTTAMGFRIEDFMTRMVPGLVWIAAFIMIAEIDGEPVDLPPLNITNVLIIGFISYIFGEANHLARENIRPVPSKFKRAVYSESKDTRHLGRIQTFSQKNLGGHRGIPYTPIIVPGTPYLSIYANHDFRSLLGDLEREYDIDSEELSIGDIYTLVRSSLKDELSEQTRGYQSTYVFTMNFIFSVVFWMALFVVGSFFIKSLEFELSLLVVVLTSILVLPLVLAFLASGQIQTKFVDSLITDYFVYRNDR